MLKIELNGISDNTKGVPDCWHLDSAGKPNPEVFQKHFGLPRSLRNDKKLLEVASVRSKRLSRFVSCLLHYRNRGIAVMLTGDENVSPEVHALTRFDEGWHLRGEQDLVEVSKLEDDELKRKLTDLLAERQRSWFRPHQVKLQALANRANTTNDRAFTVMSKCAIDSWLKARNELAKWDQLDSKGKQLVAEVIFSGFTFFGKSALEDAANIEPEVFSFFQTFLGLTPPSAQPSLPTTKAYRKDGSSDDKISHDAEKGSPPGVGAAAGSLASPTESSDSSGLVARITSSSGLPAEEHQPQSLKEFYSLLGVLVDEAKESLNPGPEVALRVSDLLEKHLLRLTDLHLKISEEEVLLLIERYSDAVLNMTDVLEFNNSDQRDLVPVLRAAWKMTIVSALEDGRPKAWFDVNLRERSHLPEFIVRFHAEQKRIADANFEINSIREQLNQAKFTVRATLKAKETQKNNEINNANQELEIIRIEAAHSLVPEGRTLDDLMDQVEPLANFKVEVQGFDSNSVTALKETLGHVAGQHRQNLDSATSVLTTQLGESLDERSDTASQEATVLNLQDEKPVPRDTNEAKNLKGYEQASGDQTIQTNNESDAVDQIHSGAQQTLQTSEIDFAVNDEERRDGFEPDEFSTSEVDSAIKHLYWAESKEEAQKAFRIAYDQFSQVPSYLVEAVALHWVEYGHLSVAAQILRDANDSNLLADQVLDASLLRSAFFGMHLWPKDSIALSFVQRQLNLLNHRDLEAQLARKPSGKVVPYFLICATFQPALFAGGETQAPSLLKRGAEYFDDHLRQLFLHTADFSLRGGRLDLEVITDSDTHDAQFAAAKARDQVATWVHLNQQRTNRWVGLRVALRNCIKKPILANAIAAIKAGESGDSSAVRAFISMYSSHTESRRLLDELVDEIRADAMVSDNIDNQAYSTFSQQIDSLVAIANNWLLQVASPEVQPKEVRNFFNKFQTLLERSILSLESHPGHADLEHRAGSAMLLRALTRLQGEIVKPTHNTWRFDQTDATFRLPETLARLDLGDANVDLRLEWFAMQLASPNWLADMMEVARRHHAHWVRLLLLRQIEEISGPRDLEIASTLNEIASVRADLKKALDEFRNLSLQAMSVDIISEGDHLTNVDLIATLLGTLSDRQPYVDVADIHLEVKRRSDAIKKVLNSSAALLQEEFDRELLNIRVKVGPDAVPDGWEERARKALEKRNLSLVGELRNQLREHSDRNSRLVETSLLENVELQAFLRVEGSLFRLLHDHPNPREAGERVISENLGGLDYSKHKPEFKQAISTLLDWRSKGKNKKTNLEKVTYEGIVTVLQFLGLDVNQKIGKPEVLNSCEYSPTGDFRRLKVRISRPTLPKGMPLFDGDVSPYQSLNIIFVQGGWSQAALIDLIERNGLPDKAILMVGHPLSSDERRAFGSFCREQKCTIFLVDPVILSFVATARNPQVMLETFLRTSAAWTFYNPYTKGDARLPAPPEMRFGREKDIASLIEPRGAALVYGGRQLGKTTLLNAAVQEFKKRDPLHNHAYYIPMDGIFQHVEERGINVKKRLFEQLVLKLVDDEVLSKNQSNSQMDPEDRLRQEFLRAGSSKVLFCLDEIDSVLNKDAATNFELIRALKGLVNDQHHRFRVVLAGLNNVNRFREYPNVPLEQLGSPLRVGILPFQDARNLIVQPLTSLGYGFEELVLVDRIMAFTNRHPSLLHIFCSELVEQLGRDRFRGEGIRLIRQTDIENIEHTSDVRRLSGERFDMTLNLDKRYTVIIYGLIYEYTKAIGQFTVSQALEIARALVPEEFKQMSETGFESLLQELDGLGVLRQVDGNKKQYALRNQSILQLIGSVDDIHHKLQQAINGLKNHGEDILTCHATGSGSTRIPSPLSLQDERTILSARNPVGAPNYSVAIIMGTPALGLTPKDMRGGFDAISEFQSGSALTTYENQLISDAATVDLKRFSERINTAIEIWAATKPAVVLISLEDFISIDRILDLLSIAIEMAQKATRLKHRLRLVFLLGAKAMWSWHAHPWLTSTPNEIGGQVELNRWSRHACENLLEQQGMSFNPEQGEMLRAATEGWYYYLITFIDIRKKRESAASFNEFSRVFKPICELAPKEFEKHLNMSGMNSFTWSLQLAAKLKEFDMLSNFSRDDVQTAIDLTSDEQPDFSIMPEQAEAVVNWWASLRVLEVNDKERSKNADREGQVTYRFVPSIQRAINEHRQLGEGKEIKV